MRRTRYEVWSYSPAWGKWIRDIYPDKGSALVRYEDLVLFGEVARPPRPANLPLPLKDRLGFALSGLFKRPSFGQGPAQAVKHVKHPYRHRPHF